MNTLKKWNFFCQASGVLILMATSVWLQGATIVHPTTTASQIHIHNLTRQSWIETQRGNKHASLGKLFDAQKFMLSQSHSFTEAEHKKIGRLIKAVNDTSDFSSRKFHTVFRTDVSAIDPLGIYPKLNLTPTSPRVPVSNLLQRINNAFPQVFFAKTNVKMFGTEFRKGISDPAATLDLEKFFARFAPSNAEQVISEWENTPLEKRVFVTGSSSDVVTVARLKRQYADEGYTLFFYKDCKPHCREATIGAIFATSAAVIHIQSAGTEKSPYVPIEVGLVAERNGIGKRIYIVDSDHLKRSIESGTYFVDATLLTCAIGAFLSDEGNCFA